MTDLCVLGGVQTGGDLVQLHRVCGQPPLSGPAGAQPGPVCDARRGNLQHSTLWTVVCRSSNSVE